MFNFINKCYDSLIKKVDYFKKASEFKNKELRFNEGRIRSRYNNYIGQLAILENKANYELENIDQLKKDVNSRYWTNIYRFFRGGILLQDLEENIGVEYVFDDYARFRIVDKEKYVVAKRDLEAVLSKTEVHDDLKPYITNNVSNNGNNDFDNKLKNYENAKQPENKSSNHSVVKSNSSSSSSPKINSNGCAGYATCCNKKSLEKEVSTYNPVSLKKNSVAGSALYISSFRDDCFTNKIANVSASYQGAGRDVANILASYVKTDSSKLVSPHKRSWKSRVDNLENAILKNNFSSKDREALKEIKNALSKNIYLVNKKSDLYERAVSLIDSAIGRGEKYGAS